MGPRFNDTTTRDDRAMPSRGTDPHSSSQAAGAVKHVLDDLPRWLRLAAPVVAVAYIAIAGLAFTVSFDHLRGNARPYLGDLAWAFPVIVDVLILVSNLAWLILAIKDAAAARRDPQNAVAVCPSLLPYFPRVLIALTIWGNVAGQTDPTGWFFNGAAPALYGAMVEFGIVVARNIYADGAQVRRKLDRIRFIRWLLAPLDTWFVRDSMVRGEQPSLEAALDARIQFRAMRIHYRAEYGARWMFWRAWGKGAQWRKERAQKRELLKEGRLRGFERAARLLKDAETLYRTVSPAESISTPVVDHAPSNGSSESVEPSSNRPVRPVSRWRRSEESGAPAGGRRRPPATDEQLVELGPRFAAEGLQKGKPFDQAASRRSLLEMLQERTDVGCGKTRADAWSAWLKTPDVEDVVRALAEGNDIPYRRLISEAPEPKPSNTSAEPAVDEPGVAMAT